MGAVRTSRAIFDQLRMSLWVCRHVFDTYEILETGESEPERDMNVRPAPLGSDFGLEMYDAAWEATTEDFQHNIGQIREIIDSYTID